MTPKRERFVDEYLKDLNATQAAIRAGYSERSARQIGDELLSKPDVRQAIQERRAGLSAKAERTALDVLADIGRVRAHCMELVQTEAGQSMRSPKEALKALELEGKHLGAFVDRVQLTGKDGGPVQQVTRIELIPMQAKGSGG